MARQVKSEGTEQPEVQIEPEVTKVEEVKIEPEVKKPTAAVTGKVTKKTRIHCVENVDCIVAGNRYKFPKGKETEVPDDVAAILSSAKKAFRM
jgi:hypothetical protein